MHTELTVLENCRKASSSAACSCCVNVTLEFAADALEEDDDDDDDVDKVLEVFVVVVVVDGLTVLDVLAEAARPDGGA